MPAAPPDMGNPLLLPQCVCCCWSTAAVPDATAPIVTARWWVYEMLVRPLVGAAQLMKETEGLSTFPRYLQMGHIAGLESTKYLSFLLPQHVCEECAYQVPIVLQTWQTSTTSQLYGAQAHQVDVFTRNFPNTVVVIAAGDAGEYCA